MNKNIDTNFAFTILSVITVGFLLWHSIAIFNLEQDLKTLQNSTPSLRGGTTTQSQNDNPQNPQHVMPTTEESQDAHILYNEDGSIDTSNWKTYTNESCGFEIDLPVGWVVDSDLICTDATNKIAHQESKIGTTFDFIRIRNKNSNAPTNNTPATWSIAIFPFFNKSIAEVEEDMQLDNGATKRESIHTKNNTYKFFVYDEYGSKARFLIHDQLSQKTLYFSNLELSYANGDDVVYETIEKQFYNMINSLIFYENI